MKSLRSNLRLSVLLPTAVLALLGLGVGAFAFTGTPGGSVAPLQPLERPATGAKQGAKTGPAGPTVSLATWAKDASGICAELNRKAAELGTPQTRNELVTLLPQSLDLADAALAKLRALPAPARERADVTRMLALFGRFVTLERKAVSAISAGDTATFAGLTGKAFVANDRGNRIARALGARPCAKGGTDDTRLVRELRRHGVVVAVLYSPGANVDALAIREARAGAGLAGAGFVAIDVYDAKEIAPVAAQYAVRQAPSVLVFTRAGGAVSQFGGYVDRDTVAQAADNASV